MTTKQIISMAAVTAAVAAIIGIAAFVLSQNYVARTGSGGRGPRPKPTPGFNNQAGSEIIGPGAGGSSPITVADGSITLYSLNPFIPMGASQPDNQPHQNYTIDDRKSYVPYIQILGCPVSPTPGVNVPGCAVSLPPSVLNQTWTLTLADGTTPANSTTISENAGSTTVSITLKTAEVEQSTGGIYYLAQPSSSPALEPATLTITTGGSPSTYMYNCPKSEPANTGKCVMLIHYCPQGNCD
jgi:hypothetical protein